LTGERVAFDLERRVWQSAEDCLRTPELAQSLANIAEGPVGDGTRSLSLDTDVIRARCPIVAQFFLKRDNQLRFPSDDRNGRTYKEQEAFPRAAEKHFRISSDIASDRLYALAFQDGTSMYQTYYMRPASARGQVLGILVNMDWVAGRLLTACVSEALRQEPLSQGVQLRLMQDTPSGAVAAAGGISVPLKTTLAYWELYFPPATLNVTRIAAQREMWFVGISVVMILSVLGLASFLLLRLTPELRLIQLQSEFVSRVSHELRTPLTLIRLYAETLTSDASFSEEERHSYLRVITRETERLGRMINNVLEFSANERGKKQSDLREGDLGTLIARVLGVYANYLSHDGFAVRSMIQTNLPPVRFDAEEITQAVLNLIENARKYSGDSREATVRLLSEKGRVILEVEDHGTGISPEEREKIFEPFYRSRAGSQKDGWGLGLYIVRRVMERHGGKVEVESQVGLGSRFRLVFPVWKAGLKRLRQDDLRAAVR
jgi:signal transduction histidine kinase